MKIKLLIFVVLLLLISGLSCGEPAGGGAGYQYLGRLRSIQFNCDARGDYTTIVRVNDDTFTLTGKAPFSQKRSAYSYVWVNIDKNTIRLRQRNITSEHPILSWQTLDWRKNECK